MLTTSRHSLHELFGGRGEQWHNINIHPQQLTEIEALSLFCPLNSRIPCLSFLLQELRKPGSSSVFSCSVTQGCSFRFPHQLLSCTRKIPTGASFGYRNSQGAGGKSVLLHLLSTQTFNLFVFHSSALSFGEYLRTGQLQAYKDFFFSGLKGRYE